MNTPSALQLSRGLFAVFTMGILAVTFYFPIIGLGYLMDQSADFKSRGAGLLYFLPSVTLLLFLVGLFPPVQQRSLLWLGIIANLLLLPPAAACVYLKFPAAIGSFVALAYVITWWLLVRSKLI